MHTSLRTLPVALLTALSLAGCGGWPELSLWVHTDRLVMPAKSAAERIETATGLVVAVNETMPDSTPVFESATLSSEEDGRTGLIDYDHTAKEGVKFIAIDAGVPAAALEAILMHEFIHALGVEGDLADPNALMNGGAHDNYRLTSADLRALCKVRECSRQVAEI
jgi:hypothetical protein